MKTNSWRFNRATASSFAALVAGVALAVGGCGGDDTGDGDDEPDPDRLTGSNIDVFVTADGEVEVPHDLSADFDLEVLVPGDDGQFTSRFGVGAADGTFTVDDVPPGLVFVRTGSEFLYTDERVIELGRREFRRADAVRTPGPAIVNFDVGAMTNFEPGDRLELIGADTFGRHVVGFGNLDDLPPIGATEFTSSVDYATGVTAMFGADAALVDGSAGDRFFVTHQTERTSPEGAPYQSVIEVFEPAPFTMVEGGTVDVAGDFQPVADTESLTLRVDSAALSAQFAAMLPPGSETLLTLADFTVSAEFGLALDAPGGFATLLFANLIDRDGEMTLGYGDPFAGAAEQSGSLVMATGRVYEGPSGAEPTLITVAARVDDPANFAAGPIGTTLSPASNPRIDGADAMVRGDAISATPTVSWDPPGGEENLSYSVRIFELADRRVLVALIVTDETEVPIPPGLLEPGVDYVFDIRTFSETSTFEREIIGVLTEQHTVAAN